MKEQHIYLIFSRSGTFLSKLIYLFTLDKYVHVSLSFNDKFDEMYSLGRKNPRNPVSGGLVKEDLRNGVFKIFKNSECLIYKVRVSKEQYDSLYKDVQYHYNLRKNYKYNFLGLLSLLFNLSLNRKNYYFCSQFVSEVLMKNNILFSAKEPQLTKPSDLLNIENHEVIFEGYTADLDSYTSMEYRYRASVNTK